MLSLIQNAQGFVNFLRSEININVALLILLAVSTFVYFAVSILTKRFFLRLTFKFIDDTSLKEIVTAYNIPQYIGAFVAITLLDLGRNFFAFHDRIDIYVAEGELNLVHMISGLIDAILFVLIILILDRIIRSVGLVYSKTEMAKGRPLKGLITFLRSFIFLIATLIAITLALEKSPWNLLASLGAISAVAALIFRHTLVSLTAGLQLAASENIAIGDWIEIPEFSANGIVVDVSLHTVTIQNWDKALISVPVHQLTEKAFTNWKGMSEFGGRLFKRSIVIDGTSVKFSNIELLERLANIDIIQGTVQEQVEILHKFRDNLEKMHKGIPSEEIMRVRVLNGPYLTNLDLYQTYLSAYLHEFSNVRNDSIIMIRQLKPVLTGGLPIEIYCFIADVDWINFEKIQGSLYATFLAALEVFDLKMYSIGQDNAHIHEGDCVSLES